MTRADCGVEIEANCDTFRVFRFPRSSLQDSTYGGAARFSFVNQARKSKCQLGGKAPRLDRVHSFCLLLVQTSEIAARRDALSDGP